MRRLLISLVTATALVTGCSSSKGPTLDYTPEFSILTKPGINQIKESRHARFDLRDLDLTKADTGVEPVYDLGPMIGNASGPELTLELLGPTGTEIITTRTFMVDSLVKDEPYTGITFWRDFDNPADANTELRDGITRWGFHPDRVQDWLDYAAAREDAKSYVSLGIGASGLLAGVEARQKNGHTLLRYEILLEPKYYEPDVLANIRATGNELRRAPR